MSSSASRDTASGWSSAIRSATRAPRSWAATAKLSKPSGRLGFLASVRLADLLGLAARLLLHDLVLVSAFADGVWHVPSVPGDAPGYAPNRANAKIRAHEAHRLASWPPSHSHPLDYRGGGRGGAHRRFPGKRDHHLPEGTEQLSAVDLGRQRRRVVRASPRGWEPRRRPASDRARRQCGPLHRAHDGESGAGVRRDLGRAGPHPGARHTERLRLVARL